MSNSRGGGPPALSSSPPPVNGVAKKLAKNGADRDRDSMTTVNGGNNRPPAGHGLDSPVHQPQPHTAASRGNSPLNGGGQHQQPTGLSYNPAGNTEQPAPPAASTNTPMDCPDSKPSERPPSLATDTSSLSPTDRQTSLGLGSLGVDVKERTQQSQSRQGEIEGRLRRLRKRLQVVQAKQVEHHVQQQLGGLLESTLGPLDALRPGGRRGGQDTPLTPQEREGLGRFLKDGSVPAELERLSLSGTTNLRSTESAFDSDATESSSGGETDVEEDELTRVDIEQRHISLWRRAEGRYAVDRASIVSHWNWLQAHVSDLEYRIRQQTDIYRQLRSNKVSTTSTGSSTGTTQPNEPSYSSSWCVSCRNPNHSMPTTVSEQRGWVDGDMVHVGIAAARCPSQTYYRVWTHSTCVHAAACCFPSSGMHNCEWKFFDDTCVSARTRPLLSCKRRRLVRPSTLTNLNRKGQRLSVPGPRCGCEVNPQCMTCGGRTLSSSDVQYERPLLERLSQFDPCVHPILSLTDDVAMSLHLQRVLKSHWNSRPLEKIKPLKKLSLKHKLSVGRPHDPSASFTPKDKHKMTNSLLSTVRLSHHKVRSEKLHRQQLDSLLGSTKLEGRPHYRGERGHGPYDKSHARKRPREHSLSLDRMDNTPKLYLDGGSLCPSLSAGLHTTAHSSLLRQLSASSETCSMPFTPFNSSLRDNSTPHQPIRRRRGESSFDINNIVIPMSVAATTRVEKLQYKEILTPSWKEVDICAKPIAEEADIEEVEDLTDTAFSQLHQSCEDQERSRWSWTASAIAKRRGSRSYVSGRSDGRTTPLLGSNNPSSPDTAHFHALPDYGSAASPCSPASPDLQSYPYAPGCYTVGGYSYTPIGSRDSYRLLSNEDTRCSTPDGTYEELVPIPVHPWDRRSFPLENDPPPEPEEQAGNTEERPYRTMRHISGCKTGSSRSESDTGGPPSPLPPDDSSKQKAPSASTTLTRPSHR
ncbi:unnamed protein product [Oncorhynchus mykiss]|uniref:PEHE domain-containing protein n=1 Tax=Oncorhynchus mykiss TaxID=8022 RepID=A0A060WE62_ONCMY|nr:unnamed protein product [Oncorhynchus mykiss]